MNGSIPRIDESKQVIYSVTIIAALGGLLFGFDTGVISGALTFINQTFTPSTFIQEIIVSIVVLGAFLGAITSGRLADRWGRRKLLIIAALLFICGTVIATLAFDLQSLIVGRFIIGIAIGISSYTAPLFISEIAPKDIRGKLVLLNALAITGGEALAYLSDYFLTGTQSWRLMFAVSVIPAIVLLIGMLRMPETPRWLMHKGLTSQAKAVLKRLRSKQSVDSELNEIKKNIKQGHGTWSQLFSKKIRPVLIIGLGLGILQQFVGINTVMYYGPIIFQQAGFQSTQSQIFATFIMGFTNMVFSFIAILIVERIGRRKLLLHGNLVAALSLAIVGWAFHAGDSLPYSQWIACIAMITYITGYCLSLGSLFWLIISEIYPLAIRGIAMSFVASTQWAANFIVAATFLTLLHAFGAANTFWLYGIICAIAWVFCYCFVPETSGVSLEAIEHNLELGKPSRELGQDIEQPWLPSPTVTQMNQV